MHPLIRLARWARWRLTHRHTWWITERTGHVDLLTCPCRATRIRIR